MRLECLRQRSKSQRSLVNFPSVLHNATFLGSLPQDERISLRSELFSKQPDCESNSDLSEPPKKNLPVTRDLMLSLDLLIIFVVLINNPAVYVNCRLKLLVMSTTYVRTRSVEARQSKSG
ncbi:hypothetical protein VNO77_03020 [Canavalia gladiata]|uniref:Uncharacterized protein n=1 Tax=Canavalia gladiata TaxID=3824 RepID=A0AAN9MZ72_CANGL